MCVCLCVCVCVCMHVSVFVCVCVSVCLSVCCVCFMTVYCGLQCMCLPPPFLKYVPIPMVYALSHVSE